MQDMNLFVLVALVTVNVTQVGVLAIVWRILSKLKNGFSSERPKG